MAGKRQDSRWVIRPSLWFDAVCLVPLLAGLSFYTSRHEHDAREWRERFASAAGQQARDGLCVLRDEVADRRPSPVPRTDRDPLSLRSPGTAQDRQTRSGRSGQGAA